MTTPKVAVLLPTFNSAKFILAQIGSIIAQENVQIDIYIYDDGSSDDTVALIKSMLFAPNIFYVENEGSFGRASLSFLHLMRTVDLVRYDYVSLADHDDIWSCYKISAAIYEMLDTNSDAFSSSVLSVSLDRQGYTSPHLVRKHGPQRTYDYLFEGPGPGCTFVLSKKFIVSFCSFLDSITGGLDFLRWHDWFIYYFARMNKFTWVISRHPNMLYLQWGTNDTGVNRGLKALIQRFSWVFSGWYFDQSKLMYNTILENSVCAEDQVDFDSYKFWISNGLSLRRSYVESAFFCLVAIVNVFKSKLQ